MAMGLGGTERWAVAAIAALVALLAVDLATGPEVLVLVAYAIPPLLASFGTTWRMTAAVGALAVALATASWTVFEEMDRTNGLVLVATVAVLGALAGAAALVRTRREASVARAALLVEAGALLAAAEDPRAALRAVADRCAIDLTGPEGAPQRAAAAPRTPPHAVEQALARVAGGAAPEASRSELVLPLTARNARLGALALGMGGS